MDNNADVPGSTADAVETTTQWPLWEVFVQADDGTPHTHAGSIHAVDKEMALQNARDVYARRDRIVSVWVVPSAVITASCPADKASFFDPMDDTVYRHPQFYKIPRGIKNL